MTETIRRDQTVEQVFEVLARTKRETPLQIIGTVKAHTPKLAVVYASKTYDEFRYIDMKVVPRSQIQHVFSKSPILERG